MNLDKNRKEPGKLLLEMGLITESRLDEAEKEARKTGIPLIDFLLKTGVLSKKDHTRFNGKLLGFDFVDLENFDGDHELICSLPEHILFRHRAVPVSTKGRKMVLAMADPLDIIAIDDIRLISGFEIEPAIAVEADINSILEIHFDPDYKAPKPKAEKEARLEVAETAPRFATGIPFDKLIALINEPPIVRVVNLIIAQAINDSASEIHIEPESNIVNVRFLIDGALHDVMSPPKHIQEPVIGRIKILAGMDLSNVNNPQDGSIHLVHDNRAMLLRASTFQTTFGEGVRIWILQT